jgi:bifunctional non-homologous end joining protein LigD
MPRDESNAELTIDSRVVRLTNLQKPFWPDDGITKGDLLQYYADVSHVLLPHLHDRAMVMKRYPNGARGKCFFMKRAPSPRPEWIETCSIEHKSGNVIDFPMVQDLPSLLWLVNLGCIDLNQWYARCDDVDRPDYLHFDLDPVPGAGFAKVLDAALTVREALESFGMSPLVKTTGSKGVHIYVPIVRGPTQKEVWTFAKALAQALSERAPKLLTAEYRIANRPRGRVLVDYNQNARGRTLASLYSPRPTPPSWTQQAPSCCQGS